MSTEFYNLPDGVVDALIKHSYVQGSVLVPYDPIGSLTDNLKQHRCDVTTNDVEENLFDPNWWAVERSKGYDWVVCPTIGKKDHKMYILEYGLQIARDGIAVLDRLSFLEPVTSRRNFLLKNKLSNIIILSPRPRFNAVSTTRDSVTAAWFLFQHPDKWRDGTQVSYAINWDNRDPSQPLPVLP